MKSASFWRKRAAILPTTFTVTSSHETCIPQRHFSETQRSEFTVAGHKYTPPTPGR
ncbi:Hypothetical protein FKW44_005777 [Caligus rogercresseyi]|uniref:Uncharacterized protein n=1 Tax=Caligus rogercresseyi TaxID=217165 RepID=A0A7T8QS96_CALRO|nr:Hypothetical protein FKW44_005777 [Caligus rogercresseyi]